MLTLERKPKTSTAEYSRPTPTFPISICLRDYPEYAAADDRLRELKAEKAKVEARMDEIRTTTGSDRRGLDQQARDYLDGVVNGGKTRQQLQDEYRELDGRLRLVRRAIEMQTVEVSTIRGRVSQEIARAVRPMYEAHLNRMMEAAITLGQLADEEEVIRQTLMAHQVTFTGIMPAAPLRHAQLGAEANQVNLWLDNIRCDYNLTPDLPTAGAGGLRRSK